MIYSEGFSLRPVLLHPQTRGVVRLQSRDPNDHPYIEPNYLAHPDDIKILVEGEQYFIPSLRRRRDEMYIGHSCLCECLSLTAFPHYHIHMDLDVR